MYDNVAITNNNKVRTSIVFITHHPLEYLRASHNRKPHPTFFQLYIYCSTNRTNVQSSGFSFLYLLQNHLHGIYKISITKFSPVPDTSQTPGTIRGKRNVPVTTAGANSMHPQESSRCHCTAVSSQVPLVLSRCFRSALPDHLPCAHHIQP